MQNSSNRPYFNSQTNLLSKRAGSPGSVKQQYINYGAMTERMMTPPQTEIKISKTMFKNGNPTPPTTNNRHFRSESSHTFVIEKPDPVSFRLQNLNQTKNQLYNDLNQMNNENQALNGKLQNLQTQYQSQNQTMYCKETLIQELMKIKEILDKCDFRNNQVSLQYNELQTIQSIIYNITNNLKLFEEKLSMLWSETERLGREVIDWQNTCTHQDAVYQIRLNDLTQQFSQKNNFQSNITINDVEYKNRIKGLEKRVNELEIVILTINNEKENILKEMSGDLHGKIKGGQKEYDEKILVLTSQIEKLLKIVEEKNQMIDNLRKNFNKNPGENYNKNINNSFDNYNSNYQMYTENDHENFTKPYSNEKTKATGQISPENTPNFLHLQQVNKELMQSIQTKVHECNESKLLCGELKREKMNFLEKIKYLEIQISLFKENVSKEEIALREQKFPQILEKSKKQLEELYQKNQELEHSHDKMRKEEMNYKILIEQLQSDSNDFKSKVEATEKNFIEETRKSSDKKISFEKELKQANLQINELLRKNKNFEETIGQLQNEENNYKNTINDLERQLVELKEKYERNEERYNEEIEEVRITYDEEKLNEIVNNFFSLGFKKIQGLIELLIDKFVGVGI